MRSKNRRGVLIIFVLALCLQQVVFKNDDYFQAVFVKGLK